MASQILTFRACGKSRSRPIPSENDLSSWLITSLIKPAHLSSISVGVGSELMVIVLEKETLI